MSSNASLFPLAAAGMTAFGLVAAVFVTPDFAMAAGARKSAPAATTAAAPGCSCPRAGDSSANANPNANARLADLKAGLDENDQIAALESLQYALTEVADGSSYVWHRAHGRLSGVVKPTASFKDQQGAVCRHVVVVLNSTDTTRKTEAVACRQANGVWELEG